MKSGARESTVSQDMWLQNQTQKSNNKQTCQNEEEGKKKEGIFAVQSVLHMTLTTLLKVTKCSL